MTLTCESEMSALLSVAHITPHPAIHSFDILPIRRLSVRNRIKKSIAQSEATSLAFIFDMHCYTVYFLYLATVW